MRTEQLKKEIQDKIAELAKLEKQLTNDSRTEAIKELSEFSTSEKVEVFDTLYDYVISGIKEVEKSGYIDEDSAHYDSETLLEIVSRDKRKFWDYYNSLTH